MINVPTSLTVTDTWMAMDGGSIWIKCVDLDNTEHSVYLPQWTIPENITGQYIAGRLYWDELPVPIRSSEETQLLSCLDGASFEIDGRDKGDRIAPKKRHVVIGDDVAGYLDGEDESPIAAMAHLVRAVCEFVRSELYLGVARKQK